MRDKFGQNKITGVPRKYRRQMPTSKHVCINNAIHELIIFWKQKKEEAILN